MLLILFAIDSNIKSDEKIHFFRLINERTCSLDTLRIEKRYIQ